MTRPPYDNTETSCIKCSKDYKVQDPTANDVCNLQTRSTCIQNAEAYVTLRLRSCRSHSHQMSCSNQKQTIEATKTTIMDISTSEFAYDLILDYYLRNTREVKALANITKKLFAYRNNEIAFRQQF